MRLIDADRLLEQIQFRLAPNSYDAEVIAQCVKTTRRHIEEAPTINPESLKPKGRWVGEGDGYADGELVYDVWYCSECNHCIDDGTDDPEMLPNYCPNCGADMRGGTNE